MTDPEAVPAGAARVQPPTRGVMPALMLGTVLGAFEGMVVGTAMPRVVASVGGLADYNWVFTLYMLTSTVTIPVFGKLGDQFGRKRVYMAGIGLFTLGALLCALAPNMLALILARGVQGLGFGAMYPMSMAIVGEIFPPNERGKVQGYFAPIFAIGGIIGPTLGGWIVDALGWRWIFGCVVPLGAVALLALGRMLPRSRTGAPQPLDLTGAALVMAAVTPFLLALQWGGTRFAWGSPAILGMFAGAAVLFVAFLLQERRARSPILPLSLLAHPVFANSAATEFLSGTLMFGTMAMVPLFVQGVLGLSPARSGAIMAPVTVLVVGSNILAGQVMMRMQRYKPVALTGLGLQAVGYGALAVLGPRAPLPWLAAAFAVGAVGMGVMIPIYTTVVQNSVHDDQIGQATAGLQFFTQLGEALGISTLALVFVRGLQASGVAGDPSAIFRPEAVLHLGGNVELLRGAIAHGFEGVTWVWAVAALLSLALGIVLQDARLRGRDEATSGNRDGVA